MMGTYTIILELKKTTNLSFGKLGNARARKGFYLYTGSALGSGAASLGGRLERHFRASKKARWHVDYLTACRWCNVRAAVCLRSRKRLECSVNRDLNRRLDVEPLLPHIGASDCKCNGHLMVVQSSLAEDRILARLIQTYSDFGNRVFFHRP